MPIVTMPDGVNVQFPDDMQPEQIRGLIASKFPEAQQEAKKDAYTDYETSVQGRFMHGMADPLYGIAQLVPRGVSKAASLVGADKVADFYSKSAQDMDAMAAKRAQRYEQQKQAAGIAGKTDLARIAGGIATPVNAAVAKGITLLPEATSFSGRLLQNAALGGVSAATQPIEDTSQQSFASQKLSQVGVGAAVPAAMQTAGSVVGGLLKPSLQKGAENLMKEGIRLTPGQLKGGWLNAVEEKLQSLPLVGDSIKSARLRGYEDFNKAVAQRVLTPIGEKVPANIEVGRDLVDYVGTRLSDRYAQILPKMRAVVDDQLMKDVSRIGSKSKVLPDQQIKVFQSIVEDKLGKRTTGQISGDELKEITSDIMTEAAGYRADTNFDNRKLGDLLMEFKDALTENAARHSPAELTKALKETDRGWANLVRYEKAASSLGAKGGVISPAQLQNAVKQSEKSVRGRKFARGDNLMQDLSDDALSVLPPTVPNSGTFDRAALGAVGLGGVGYLSPASAAAGLGTAALYTRPGVAALETLIARRPEWAAPAAKAIRQGTSPIDLVRALMGGKGPKGSSVGVPAKK